MTDLPLAGSSYGPFAKAGLQEATSFTITLIARLTAASIADIAALFELDIVNGCRLLVGLGRGVGGSRGKNRARQARDADSHQVFPDDGRKAS